MREGNVIRIPFAIPSRNTLDKMHWAKKRRLQNEYRLFVRQQMTKYKISKWIIPKKGEIYLQSVKRYEIRDYDNLMGGAKLMIDALVKEGFIFDDTIKLIGTPRIRQSSLKRWKEGIEEIMGKKGDQLVQAKYNRSKYWDVEHTTIIRTERED
tara:strand:+ start:884 stop:1342 length:459 start_codon:yes stop_codon:yes gene_type:complete